MIAAYCWPQSALPEESIKIFCHTEAASFKFSIFRQGKNQEKVFNSEEIDGKSQVISSTISVEGCDWESSYELIIEPHWSSGFYLLRLDDSNGDSSEAFFVVRANGPKDGLLVLSTSTWNAYNTWGGPSFYTGGHVTSFKRPLPPGFLSKKEPERHRIARFKNWPKEDARAYVAAGYDDWSMAAGWANWEILFTQWAESCGYDLGYAVSQDLDNFPDLLTGFPLYISVGHDEYWSEGMRNNVENFVEGGGNAAFLSGNTSFWQVRFGDDYRQMTGYKADMIKDPLYDGKNCPTLATMWSDPLIGRPETQMTGVSFSRGGYAHMPNSPDGTGGYTVWQPQHWIYEGTSLKMGDVLGGEQIVVGYECDGCDFEFVDEKPVPTGVGGTPLNFEILGIAPAHLWETDESLGNLADNYVGELNWVAERIGGADTPEVREKFTDGHAVLGIFKKGKGEVFTSGCTDWAYGLKDKKVDQVTRNMISRFMQSGSP